jgi:hypothetical protein
VTKFRDVSAAHRRRRDREPQDGLARHDPPDGFARGRAQWMENNRFFDVSGLGLERRNVYFEGTREDKDDTALECDLFVDDLADVLGHAEMPTTCRKILFGSDRKVNRTIRLLV